MTASFRISVNGVGRVVRGAPDTPLLWVLRDELGAFGTKYGCGIGACGACAVLMNGTAVRACTIPISALGKSRIVTIEGLRTDSLGARVQAAWEATDVPQCGYCQSGMVVESVALLREHPQPSAAQIDSAIGTHICRCGTYLRIREAIEKAAGERS